MGVEQDGILRAVANRAYSQSARRFNNLPHTTGNNLVTFGTYRNFDRLPIARQRFQPPI